MRTASLLRAPIDGGELEYLDSGNGDAVLFIHGAGIADSFRPLVNAPALVGYRQIHYRRRCYGGSARTTAGPETFIPRAALDAAGLLQHLRVDRAHIVGHSSGALIALQLACTEPRLVRSLVLLEPPVLAVESGAAHFAAIAPAVERYAAGDPVEGVNRFWSLIAGPEWRAGASRTVPGGPEQAEADATTFFEFELPGVGAWQPDQDALNQLRQPALFMMGSDTVLFHKQARDIVHAWLPHTEDHVVPGVNHALQIIDPDGVAEGIRRFLARH